ncbi:hypothetical protein HNR34_000634 [Geobacillus subterraneus]
MHQGTERRCFSLANDAPFALVRTRRAIAFPKDWLSYRRSPISPAQEDREPRNAEQKNSLRYSIHFSNRLFAIQLRGRHPLFGAQCRAGAEKAGRPLLMTGCCASQPPAVRMYSIMKKKRPTPNRPYQRPNTSRHTGSPMAQAIAAGHRASCSATTRTAA